MIVVLWSERKTYLVVACLTVDLAFAHRCHTDVLQRSGKIKEMLKKQLEKTCHTSVASRRDANYFD